MGHPFPRVSVWETATASRGLTDVEGAAHWLLERWPAKVRRPRSYRPALKACLAALDGSGTVDRARSALVKAAADADILDRA
ncbi:Protein of unknown function [Kaistia soli DSM 19436]|uniref:DUF982 domain-containing protein n=1 Tax=Kaistia soli DSM 19436 TaxID=1122133 RepID=A0A1M4VIY6_9HYPH|nr:DUF982 domain-containing protein [Kaistia soli]SHE69026.1 Protein of unknown function [Kaistia soli DSM 19436]